MSATPRGPARSDEIVDRLRAWATKPTLEATLDLLLWLREAEGLKAAHVDAIAKGVSERHGQSQRAMVGLGRVQQSVGRLREAQQTLIAAGRLDANARAPYVYLAQVLFERGEHGRAARMFERAAQMEPSNEEALAGDDDEVESWIAKAKAREAKSAQPAIDEKTLPRAKPLPDAPTPKIVAPPPLAASPVDDKTVPRARSIDSVPPPAHARPKSDPPPKSSKSIPPPPRSRGGPLGRVPTDDNPTTFGGSDDEDDRTDDQGMEPAPIALPAPPRLPSAAAGARIAVTEDPTLPRTRGESRSASKSATKSNVAAASSSGPHGRNVEAASPVAPVAATTIEVTADPTMVSQDLNSSIRKLPVSEPKARAMTDDSVAQAASIEPPKHITRALDDNSVTKSLPVAAFSPDAQLAALAAAGVFDREGVAGAPIEWSARSGSSSRRSKWLGGIGAFVVVGAVAGTIFGGRYLKAKHAEEAAALVADASTKVESGDLEALKSVEASLGRALELDSRSLDAARTWLHDRVLRSYLWPSDDRRDGGLASAMERGKAVGLDEDEMAYARVALALTSEDTASAVRMAKALDASSKGKAPDAWRELVIGWVLERAGDGRAFDRYAKALEIDPSLSPARLSLAKGAAQAGNVAKTTDLTAKLPAGWAVLKDDLVGLASLTAGAKRDTKVDEATARPASFGWMAASLRASDPTLAQEARRTLLDKAIVAARDPLDLTRVGRVALSLGELDEAAAAALRALEASAIFTPARALAARIALERGRVDDAVGALAGLDPKGDPEVAALSAWLAYERGDSASIGPLLDDPSIAPSAFDAPDLKGIVLPLRALTAGKIDPNDAASLDAVTKLGGLGPIVAFDAALDAGNVPVADSIGKTWRDVEGSPARASRLAKLARLTGKGAEADRLSKIATEQGVVVPRALVERALTLCGLGRADEATKLLTRYPLVAVDEQPWLRAYALALAGKVDDAKRSVAKLALPESTAPWPVRRDALLALTAVGDRTRSGPLLDLLRKERPADPDVTSAERLR